jgi:hypothetical protein
MTLKLPDVQKIFRNKGCFMVCKNTFQDWEQFVLTPYMELLVSIF